MYRVFLFVALVIGLGEIFLVSVMLTDGLFRAFVVIIASALLFGLPVQLLYRYQIASEDSQARIALAEQVSLQIIRRATGQDEAPRVKVSR